MRSRSCWRPEHPERVRRLVLVAPAGLAALPRVAAAARAVAAPYAIARRTLATPLADGPFVRRLALAGVARDGARVPADHARAVLASSAGATRIGPGLASAAAADLRATLAGVQRRWGSSGASTIPSSRRAHRRHPPRATDVSADRARHRARADGRAPEAFCAALEAVLARCAANRMETSARLARV